MESSACSYQPCDNLSRRNGLCDGHSQQLRRGEDLRPLKLYGKWDPCLLEDCDKPGKVGGYCPPHFRAYDEYGTFGGSHRETMVVRGPGYIDSDGYRVLNQPNHPNARKGGKIFEHTLMMSKFLGRPLFEGEYVTHKNNVRDDNRLENLQLCSSSLPLSHRIEDLVSFAKEIQRRYEYLTPKVLEGMLS